MATPSSVFAQPPPRGRNFKWNVRLVFVLVILLAISIIEIVREHRPSFLRPGVHLYAYVANTADGTLTAINLVSLTAVATIPVGPSPSGIRAHPKRDEIWGVSTTGGYAWVLDTRSGQIVARIPVGANPYAIDFSPDAKRAYVAASGSDAVVAIDCASR
ncbi:MAG TPA: hypothetical protein VGR39_04205, partial [Candidatus Acidoferrales bacterium]|nr:hypothetical protein [Candidatus Acidoferrales bacterium]